MGIKYVLKKILRYERIDIYRKINILGCDIKFYSRTFTKQKLCALQSNIDNLKKQLDDLKKYSDNLQLQLFEKEKSIGEGKKRNIFLENQLNKVNENKDILQKSLSEMEEQKNILQKSLSETEEQKNMLQNQVTEKSQYKKNRLCTGWISHWKEYYNKNYHQINDKLQNLKCNLDGESCKVVDIMTERNFHIFPEQRYTDLFLYDFDKIYTDFEKDGLMLPLDEKKIRSEFEINPDYYLETPVFKFHNGLCFLPKDILNSLIDKDFIDGGALWGDSALILNLYHPRKIYSFEPMHENYNSLLVTIKCNNLSDTVVPVNLALSNKKCEKELYTYGMQSGSNMYHCKAIVDEPPEEKKEIVHTITIDEYVHQNDLNVGLIKLDVEGNELETIQGAIETIKNSKPILLISIYHMPKDFFEIKPLLESLNLKYKFMIRKLVYHDLFTEVMLIGYVDNVAEKYKWNKNM